jgi:glycerol kinase
MIDNYPAVAEAHQSDDLLFGTVESWVAYVRPFWFLRSGVTHLSSSFQNLLGGVKKGKHITEVTNASRTLLLNTTTLQWESCLLDFFELKPSILPKIVSSSEVYGNIVSGALAGVPIGGLIGDQQGALIGNKCLNQGEAKCTYGTGAFLLFCTGNKIIESNHGLLSTASVASYLPFVMFTCL